jgi:Skp family chaperone for outer membrane proteins
MQSIGFLMAILAATTGQPDAGARVAVVNVPEVSDKYQRTADLEGQFEGLRAKLNQEREAMKERLDRMTKSLREELKPGSEEYRERAKQATLLEAEIKWFSEAKGQEVEEGLKISLRGIFEDIQNAVREVAEEKGIDVVLAADRLPDQIPETPTQLRQQIVLQKVLYWNPRVDITADVINRLNTRYAAHAAASGGAQSATDPAKSKSKEKAEGKRPGNGP